MKTFLKVKLKSLAEEQRIIRKEEIKYRHTAMRKDLYEHRMGLRKEIRATHLAYGFLRGRAYRQIEPTARINWYGDLIHWNRVLNMIEKYGAPYLQGRNRSARELLVAWREGEVIFNEPPVAAHDSDAKPFAERVKSALDKNLFAGASPSLHPLT